MKITLADIYNPDIMPSSFLGRFKNISKKDKDLLWKFKCSNIELNIADNALVKIYRDYAKSTNDINYQEFIAYMQQVKEDKPHLFA